MAYNPKDFVKTCIRSEDHTEESECICDECYLKVKLDGLVNEMKSVVLDIFNLNPGARRINFHLLSAYNELCYVQDMVNGESTELDDKSLEEMVCGNDDGEKAQDMVDEAYRRLKYVLTGMDGDK